MKLPRYKQIEEKLSLSIEKLYGPNREILMTIEEALGNKGINEPKVGYQGVEGSFSEEAAHNHFHCCKQLYRYNEFEDVFDAINKGEIDYGVLPIENSYTGEVLDVYDLVNKHNLYIIGEEIIKIRHNLVGLPGGKVEDIKEIYSHPQAFGQSKVFLKEHKHMQQIPYANTAMASKFISELKDPAKGAISSSRAASLYGLEVLCADINTNSNNSTRFIVLAKRMKVSKECDKVSIVFTTQHTSGALYQVLSHFAYNGVNLLKIQSRPIQNKSWHYFFFVDLEGNLEEANMLIALGKINEQSKCFRILGNYRGYNLKT